MERISEADAPCPAETATNCSKQPVEGLPETGRRVAEQRMYRALVDHAYAMARGPTAQDGWAEAVQKLLASWRILKEKYGYEERPEPAPQADGGSSRGKGGRTLDAASNAEIDLGYARIREVGENVIGPAILRVAAEDPTRTLAGFDRRIKGVDRLKEKISDRMRSKGRSAAEALAQISDVVRFTFIYRETAYADGVRQGPGTARSRWVHPSRTAQHLGIRPVQGNQYAMAGTAIGGTLRGAVSHASQS